MKRRPGVFLALALALGATPSQAALSPVGQLLRKDLHQHLRRKESSQAAADFARLVQRWTQDYGARALPELVRLSTDSTLPDVERYLAVMGLARLGGDRSVPHLETLLRERSWMIRSAVLRATQELQTPRLAKAGLKLLRDPALVVRLEAVETARKLPTPGRAQALAETLTHPANYQNGKGLWVPERALQALSQCSPEERAAARSALKQAALRTPDPRIKSQIERLL